MAFNKDIAPNQAGKGQRQLDAVNKSMRQGSPPAVRYQGGQDVLSSMKQGKIKTSAPDQLRRVNRSMKQGG